MKLEEIINNSITSIEDKVSKAVGTVLVEHGSRGVGRSTGAFFGGCSAGFSTINEEVTALLKKLAELGLNKSQIKNVRSTLNEIIDRLYIEVVDKTKKTVGENLDLERYKYEELFDKRKEESKSILEYELLLMKKHSTEKRKSRRWDIFKIITGAIVGSILTLIIKYFFLIKAGLHVTQGTVV